MDSNSEKDSDEADLGNLSKMVMHGGISIRVYFLLDCLFILQDKSRTLQVSLTQSAFCPVSPHCIRHYNYYCNCQPKPVKSLPSKQSNLNVSQNKLFSTRKNKASAACLKSSNIRLICRQLALLDCYSIRDKVFYRSNKFFFSLMATFKMIRSMRHLKDSY